MKLLFENAVNAERANFLTTKAMKLRKEDAAFKPLKLEYEVALLKANKQDEQVTIKANSFSDDELRYGIALASHLKTYVIMKDDLCERKISCKSYNKIVLTFNDAGKEVILKSDHPDAISARETALSKISAFESKL